MPPTQEVILATKTNIKPVKFSNSSVEFNKVFNSFGKKVQSNAKTFKFTPSQMKQFKSAFNSWNKQWTSYQKAYTAFMKAQSNLQVSQNNANTWMNKFWTKIANSPNNTGQFKAFGIPAKTKSTSVKRTTKRTTSRTSRSGSFNTSGTPVIRVNTSTRGKNVIYVSPSGTSKWPTNAIGAVIQYRKNNGAWHTLTTTNEFPFTHVIGSNFNGSFQYRAAFAFGNRQFGTWSKISKVAIKRAA